MFALSFQRDHGQRLQPYTRATACFEVFVRYFCGNVQDSPGNKCDGVCR